MPEGALRHDELFFCDRTDGPTRRRSGTFVARGPQRRRRLRSGGSRHDRVDLGGAGARGRARTCNNQLRRPTRFVHHVSHSALTWASVDGIVHHVPSRPASALEFGTCVSTLKQAGCYSADPRSRMLRRSAARSRHEGLRRPPRRIRRRDRGADRHPVRHSGRPTSRGSLVHSWRGTDVDSPRLSRRATPRRNRGARRTTQGKIDRRVRLGSRAARTVHAAMSTSSSSSNPEARCSISSGSRRRSAISSAAPSTSCPPEPCSIATTTSAANSSVCDSVDRQATR